MTKTKAEDIIADRRNRIKKIHLACMLFASEHDLMLPSNFLELKEQVKDGIEFSSIDTDEYILESIGKMDKYTHPCKTILCREKNPDNIGFYAVVFLDGHIELLKNPEPGTPPDG